MNDIFKSVANRSAIRATQKKKTTSYIIGLIIGHVIGIFAVGPLVLYWFNHVILQYPVAYWQYVVLSALLYVLLEVKAFSKAYTVVLLLTFICQVLSWIHLVHLPLFQVSH